MKDPNTPDEMWMMGRVGLALSLLVLTGCAEREDPVWLAERGKVYCYRTLAEPDCYARPLSGADHRATGVAPQVYFRPL